MTVRKINNQALDQLPAEATAAVDMFFRDAPATCTREHVPTIWLGPNEVFAVPQRLRDNPARHDIYVPRLDALYGPPDASDDPDGCVIPVITADRHAIYVALDPYVEEAAAGYLCVVRVRGRWTCYISRAGSQHEARLSEVLRLEREILA